MAEPSELRAVVFDLDGLIANTEDLYEQVGETMLRRRGKTYADDLRERMMGRPAVDGLQLMIDCHTLPDSLDDLMCECKEVLQALLVTSLAAMPGLYELLDVLEETNTPIAVATSGQREFADFVLGYLDVKRRFRFVLTAEDIRRGKPDPEVYLLAARRLELPTRQMLVLEDSGNGCRAAMAAGAFTVAVPNRHTRLHNFDGVQFIADTLADPQIRHALAVSS